MASVQEAYERAGVVHGDNDRVCGVVEQTGKPRVIQASFKPVRVIGWFDRIFIAVFLISIGFIIGVFVAWQPLALERIHREFNNITIYEDGSYTAQTHEGRLVSGCIAGGLCED